MPTPLQIYNPRERLAVRVADLASSPLRLMPLRSATGPVRRVLLMRLERIGDLLMVLDAIGRATRAWPTATIDLVVGSWNAPLAAHIPGISRVLIADAPWLSRGAEDHRDSWPALVAKARGWRAHGYDLVINFEPDIRSNVLAWCAGGSRRVGYDSGGGGAFLTNAAAYDASAHVSVNANRLIARALGAPILGQSIDDGATAAWPRLTLPATVRDAARARLATSGRPLVGMHVSGGRESKQWHLDRFAAVARSLATTRHATIVLTGTASDRPQVDIVRSQLQDIPVVDVCGALTLTELAALLAELDVLVTGDTGPMHLAAAMGTPVVALFGPSDPHRYGPGAPIERILRVDLPCSPCGQVRLPPERCRGHVPECLDTIGVDRVVAAACEVLNLRCGAPADNGLSEPARRA